MTTLQKTYIATRMQYFLTYW